LRVQAGKGVTVLPKVVREALHLVEASLKWRPGMKR